MTRDEFIKLSFKMGIGLSLFPALMTSCSKEEVLDVSFTGKVLIIGAGAAGLMAAYSLFQNGIDFEIIEARNRFGGRVKMNNTLADFPIDIGAEWIHEQPSLFKRLINDDKATGSIDLVPYNLETLYTYDNGALKKLNWATSFYGEYKFTSTTWYQFFEQFIVPNFTDKISYNSPIDSVDYSGDNVEITSESGEVFTGDKAILTIPLNVLKTEGISFIPDMPISKMDAIKGVNVPAGLKVFIKFSEKFYPDMLSIGGLSEFLADGRLYYDAAFKKTTNDHVMALFNVGGKAHELTDLGSDAAIIEAVLKELDEIFEGKASQYYVSHDVQNWSAEPYTLGSYSFHGSDSDSVIDLISEPLDNKVFFAGEALNKNEWATVHGAGINGRQVAEKIMTNS